MKRPAARLRFMFDSMNGPLPPVALEQLLAHREWVRRVARSLVRDENAADDLEQGVWLEALERPPRTRASLRGWIAAAMRHDLIDRRRSEKRRRVREGEPRPSGTAPSPEEVVAEAEAHRRVVDAVMGLPEPYRATVLLRYFQDLDSPAISYRMGVPPETVRTRLARALAMLRDRLGAGSAGDRGLWRLAMVLLLRTAPGGPGRMGSAGGPLGQGVIVMKASAKIAMGAAVLLTGAISWWVLRPAPRATDLEFAGGTRVSVPSPRAGADATRPVPGPGAESAVPAPPPAASPAPSGPSGTPMFPTGQKRVPRDRLPRLSQPGELPADKDSAEIEVDERGSVTVGGRTLGMEELARWLGERADTRREETAPKCSLLDVVLRVDRDLPWQGAQWLMQTCAGPAIRVTKIHFAAQSEDGAADGAIPTFLPKDLGGDAAGSGPTPVTITVRLAYYGNGSPVTPPDLVSHLEARYPKVLEQDPQVDIDAEPCVPTGEVLGVVDAVRRWGAKTIHFRGTQVLKGDTIEASMARVPARKGDLGITVLGARVQPR